MSGPLTANPEEHYGPQADRLIFERGTDGPRVIMVGIDGSPTSVHAAAYASGLARRQRCRLVVVYVAPISTFAALAGGTAAAVAKTYEEVTADLREEVRRAAVELGVPTTFIARRGDPYVELRDTAAAIKADMVVVGVSAKAGHRFVGSVAVRLVRLGRWPVVVVP
jgi:nucleotide-binding universal stress UspA family protein